MKVWKILAIVSLLFLFIGVASASSTIDDVFKMPSGFEMEEYGDWYKNNDGFELGVIRFSEIRHENMLRSHDQYQVTDLGNNTYTTTDKDGVSAFEVIQVNNNKYCVSSCSSQPSESNKEKCYSFLMEFNKLNNVEPIGVEID